MSHDFPSAEPAPAIPALTVVCCVESGPLEEMTVRMAQSLRCFGGRFAEAAIWAITPRSGPPLSAATRASFGQLNVEHHTVESSNPYDWYHFWNKTRAMVYAEEHARTEWLGFIDSDIVITREPVQLVPSQSDFTASVHSIKHVGSCGPGDEREPFWIEMCRLLNIAPDDLPWVQTPVDAARIRLYFNSGVFSYRRTSGFSARWLRNCQTILDERVGFADSKTHFVEQSTLSLTLIQMGLAWEALPYSYNFNVASWEDNEDTAGLKGAHLIHYHDAMGAHFWPQFLALVKETHPEVYQWLEPLGPIEDPSSKGALLMTKIIKAKRVAQRNAYQSKLTLF